MKSRSHLTFILPLLIFLASCTPQHHQDMERIDTLREDAEGFVQAQGLMQFKSWAFGADINQDSLYHAHPALFTRETINLVSKAASEEPDSLQNKRLKYFVRFLTLGYIDRETAPLADRASNYEAAASVTINGKAVPYRQIGGLIANEKNQERRAMLNRAVDPILDSLNIFLSSIEAMNLRLARELGYPSYTDMISDLKGYSVKGFTTTAEHVLAQTDSLYKSLLGEMLHRYLRLDLRHFSSADQRPLFRNPTFDRYFPAASMLSVLTSTYRALGIDIPSMKNVTIDTLSRPAKNPRAACFAINVPDDVRLSMKPIGGFDEYGALFHEMGHTLHYASTRENSFEFKYAGEATVTECFAFLSEYLLTNQAWLRIRKVMPTPAMKDYIRFQAFYRVWYVRRYCAKFLYEVQLHSGVQHPDSVYSSIVSNASGFVPNPSDAKRYLTDIDGGYYSAGYLRAWFLESQLNAALSRRYGANWFEHPQAGEYLRSLWALGDRLDGDELVRKLGAETISPADWLTEIKAMLLLSLKDVPATKR